VTAVGSALPALRMKDLTPVRKAALAALLFGGALLAAYLSGNGYWISFVSRTAMLALGALSLSFLIGQAGLVSFGHAAPVGLGAYAVLIAGEAGVSDLLVVFPLAFVTSALFSGTTGVIALRTRGVYFIMITLAFAQMAYYVMASLSIYGADDGLPLAHRATLFGWKLFRSDTGLALASVALLLAFLYTLERLRLSRFGMVLRAAKENEDRVAASGFEVLGYRLIALTLAGGIAGLSGALLANQAEFVSPAYMNWHRSGELIVMVVLGGTGRLGGALAGAVAVTLVEEALGHYSEFWKFGLGIVILGFALLRGSALHRLLDGVRT
jgi:branched-chain amino acid transport system permease protein